MNTYDSDLFTNSGLGADAPPCQVMTEVGGAGVRLLRVLGWVGLTLTLVGAITAGAQPKVTFKPKSLVITNATPNGKIVVCGVGDSYPDGRELMSKQSAVLTADATGGIEVPITHPAFRSIWLVVDMKADDYVIATPPGYQPKTMRLPVTAAPDLESLTAFRPMAFVFVVHSPLGAWERAAGDGTESDDGARGDSQIKVFLRSFTPIGDSPPAPAHLTPRDIVLAVDPLWMELFALRIPNGGNGAS